GTRQAQGSRGALRRALRAGDGSSAAARAPPPALAASQRAAQCGLPERDGFFTLRVARLLGARPVGPARFWVLARSERTGPPTWLRTARRGAPCGAGDCS